MDLRLDRMKALVALLPSYTRPTIHVAGTNGKGSTTAILSSIFINSSITTGRFNSPHLVHEWDCISLNGAPVTQSFYREARAGVERVNSEHDIRATNFELLTATAMQIFEAARVDLAIMEVGLGGRLDATNVLPDECIMISVITAIGLDHQEQLGRSIDVIARQKAGIARSNKVCVVAEQPYPEALTAIREVLDTMKAEYVATQPCHKRPWDEAIDGPVPLPFSIQPPFAPPPPQPVTYSSMPSVATPVKGVLSLLGDHQLTNAATALTVISTLQTHQSANAHRGTILNRIIPATVLAGLRSARWPGRLHTLHLTCPPLSPTISPAARRLNHALNLNRALQLELAVIADGAHNTAGAAALQAFLAGVRLERSRTFILGLSTGRDAAAVFAPLLRPGDSVAIVPFSPVAGMSWVRTQSPAQLAPAVKNLVGPEGDVWVAPSDTHPNEDSSDAAHRALARALRWAAARSKVAVLCGSLYLVADLYRIMKDEEGRCCS